jgi:hypothetical protein
MAGHANARNAVCRRVVRRYAVLPACALAAGVAQAQQPSPDPAIVHVYVNLVQMPVLVLDPSRHSAPPVPPSQFEVKLEGMKAFKPQHIRREGDDPISLGILIDVSDPSDPLWHDHLPEAINTLTKGMRSWDRIEVFGMDGCNLRVFGGETEPDAEKVQSLIREVVAIKPYERVRKIDGPCAHPINLWQAMSYAADKLGTRNGRHVLLTLSNGAVNNDADLTKLHSMLNLNSVTMFSIDHNAITPSSHIPAFGSSLGVTPMSRGRMSSASSMTVPEPTVAAELNGMVMQSELSGGMKLNANPTNLAGTLQQFLALVRGRYILEFPRPAGLDKAQYRTEVTIAHSHAFIRAASISVPVASPEEASDPTVEHGIASNAPPEDPVLPTTTAPTPVK